MTPYTRTRTWHQRDEDLSALEHAHRVPVPPCVSVHARGLTDNVQYNESVMLCVMLNIAGLRERWCGGDQRNECQLFMLTYLLPCVCI